MTNEHEDKEKREGEVNGHGVEMVFMGLHVKPTAFNENNIQEISSRILKIYWLDFSTGEEAIKFPFLFYNMSFKKRGDYVTISQLTLGSLFGRSGWVGGRRRRFNIM